MVNLLFMLMMNVECSLIVDYSLFLVTLNGRSLFSLLRHIHIAGITKISITVDQPEGVDKKK
jgi:hypothetical protein